MAKNAMPKNTENIETEAVTTEAAEKLQEATDVRNDTKSILSEIQSGIKDATKNDIAIDNKVQSVKIKGDELIPCRSMTSGGFNWLCKKSGIVYRWNSVGSLEYVPYEDLYQMYTNNKSYLTKPNVIVEDERVIEAFKLLSVYENVASVNRLEQAMNNPNIMQKICNQALQVNMRDLIISRLSQLRENKILTNIDVIDVAEKTLRCELIKK